METSKGTSVTNCELLFKNSQRHMVFTNCCAFTPYIELKVKYVEQLRDIVTDYLSSQPEQPTRYFKSGKCFKIPV